MQRFFHPRTAPGARPIAAGDDTVVSPATATIEELGYAAGDQLMQAKRFRYRLADFLATDDAAVTGFHDGATLTVYLAPHNYHRVHMPLAGRLREMVYVPGRRWAVNQRTARTVPGLFAANERVILWCENPAGRFAVVLVGAMNVASISLAWSGEVVPGRQHDPDPLPARRTRHLAIPTGGLLGQFNLGSTVVVVAERDLITWDAGCTAGRSVRMGEAPGPGPVRLSTGMEWQPSASIGTLVQRARLLGATRDFFSSRGLLEVETPALVQHAVTDPHLQNIPARLCRWPQALAAHLARVSHEATAGRRRSGYLAARQGFSRRRGRSAP